MTQTPSILIFAGSVRKEALSKKLARAASLEIEGQGSTANLIDLRDFPAPIYNGDEEDTNGVPPTMQNLNALIRGHDGLVVATPEYNGFFTPLLKNTMDWCSRPGASAESPSLPRSMPVCIFSSSPGAMGGVRAIPRLRDYLLELGFLVCPENQAVTCTGETFTGNGRLKIQSQNERMKVVIASFLKLVAFTG